MKKFNHWSRRARCAALSGIVVLWVACGSLVPPSGWDKERGPVIPHDTFPADCSLCHTGSNWHTLRSDFEFDHGKETGVELHGAHRETLCLYCHNDRGPVARFAARGCAGCHEDIHNGDLGADCASCHDERTWRPNGQIEQHDRTRFPLIGAHAAVSCERCHEGALQGNFVGESPECVTCHAPDLTRSVVFDHAAQGFTQDCQRCHRPVGWLPAQFDHPASFPLIQGHANRLCSACHTGGSYSGLSTDCASCHQDDANRQTDPNHVLAGFGTCEQCHTISAWRPSSWAHTAAFPLTHGHAGRRCSECHQGTYQGQSSACSACHLDDYQATTNPNHTQAGYSTDCTQCHNTTGWGGANFNHRFPRAGNHNVSCAECHTTGSYPTFSCIHCHAHSQSRMANEHGNRSGYSWNSQACLNCHPNGR